MNRSADHAVSGPWADVEIPDVTLPEFLLAGASERGARPALVDRPGGR
jgi:hypothetical protein